MSSRCFCGRVWRNEIEHANLVRTHRAAEDLAVIMSTGGIDGRPQLERDAYQRLVSALRPSPSEGDPRG